MKTRLLHFWDVLTSSYWFVPTLMVIGAIALAFTLVELDRTTDEQWLEDARFIYLGGPDGARALLSTVAASVITVAGVVFSITIAALTQASSQFGPRLLRNFMRDLGNQVVLGTFVATFIYCLLVLRTVYGTEELSFVPHIAVTGGTVLAVASLGVLIFFVHHVSQSLQAPHVVARTADELRSSIERAYPGPAHSSKPAGPGNASAHTDAAADAADAPVDAAAPMESSSFLPPGGSVPIAARRAGYLQAIEHETIIEAAASCDAVVRLLVRPGHFLTTGQLIAEAFPAAKGTNGLASKVDQALLLGAARSSEQDVEFGISQLVEIAVRALSPGVNDPFTALHCVDWLGEALADIARRPSPDPLRRDGRGVVRLIEDLPTFAGLVDAAFDQIRQNTRESVAVILRLLESIEQVARSTRTHEQREALRRHVEMIHHQAAADIPGERDRASIGARHASAIAALDGGGPSIG